MPERAAAAFSLRAPDAAYLEETLLPLLRRTADAAALATGTTVVVRLGQACKDMRDARALARRFGVLRR